MALCSSVWNRTIALRILFGSLCSHRNRFREPINGCIVNLQSPTGQKARIIPWIVMSKILILSWENRNARPRIMLLATHANWRFVTIFLTWWTLVSLHTPRLKRSGLLGNLNSCNCLTKVKHTIASNIWLKYSLNDVCASVGCYLICFILNKSRDWCMCISWI
jgi:hypothetical protein